MGRSTTSIAVKYAARLHNFTDKVDKLIAHNYDQPMPIKGWVESEDEYSQHQKEVYTTSFTKDEYVVHIINEHEYDGECYAAFSDNKEALVEFLQTFDFPVEIEEFTTAQQTL